MRPVGAWRATMGAGPFWQSLARNLTQLDHRRYRQRHLHARSPPPKRNRYAAASRRDEAAPLRHRTMVHPTVHTLVRAPRSCGRHHPESPMRPDQIVIQGAREHNLKNVTVTIPRAGGTP